MRTAVTPSLLGGCLVPRLKMTGRLVQVAKVDHLMADRTPGVLIVDFDGRDRNVRALLLAHLVGARQSHGFSQA